MKLGIVGLPNVGKSTLFNAITQAGAESANYPFCTIDPNVGVVSVPDERLEMLREIYDSKKIIPAAIEFYDIAGLVKGASKGEGLGNKFLSHIREVEAIIHVVRCFDDDNITHVDGSVSPLRDIETIEMELVFADFDILDRRIEKTNKLAKTDKSLVPLVAFLKKLKLKLEAGESIKHLEIENEAEEKLFKELNLLSAKPVIYAANVSEEEVSDYANNEMVKSVQAFADAEGSELVVVCAKVEAEIAELEDEEKSMFLEEMGLAESGLDRLIKASYHLLGLMSFLTAGPQEIRAWTIKNGTKAVNAAGKIHSDIERGFIRAEVVGFQDLVDCGTTQKAKEKGLVRLEGKEYIMQNGDVVLFRFNV